MNVVYFDGVCNLCNAVVNFLIDQDTEGKLKFASLQSEAGETMLQALGLSTESYDSFIFSKNGKVFHKSTAALEVLKTLGGGWKLLYHVLIVFPRPLRDWVYTLISENRYRWFGQRDQCRLPSPELRERFLS